MIPVINLPMLYLKPQSTFMQPESIRVQPDDLTEDVLSSMIEHDVAELPVVDENGVLGGDVTMVNITGYYGEVKGSHYPDNHNSHPSNSTDRSTGEVLIFLRHCSCSIFTPA